MIDKILKLSLVCLIITIFLLFFVAYTPAKPEMRGCGEGEHGYTWQEYERCNGGAFTPTDDVSFWSVTPPWPIVVAFFWFVGFMLWLFGRVLVRLISNLMGVVG